MLGGLRKPSGPRTASGTALARRRRAASRPLAPLTSPASRPTALCPSHALHQHLGCAQLPGGWSLPSPPGPHSRGCLPVPLCSLPIRPLLLLANSCSSAPPHPSATSSQRPPCFALSQPCHSSLTPLTHEGCPPARQARARGTCGTMGVPQAHQVPWGEGPRG